MKKQFFNQRAACQYIVDNDLPFTSLGKGNNGMNAVLIGTCGGNTTIASSDNIKAHGLRRYQQATA